METSRLQVYEVTTGVYWVEAVGSGLRILCGCPAEVIKHLIRRGYIRTEQRGDCYLESGPNAILLSDLPIQNGMLSNLTEFPILQMFYRQGMLIPNNPNNNSTKPLLLGSSVQIERQLSYIHRGNYGLLNQQEIIAANISAELAEEMMAIKLSFAYGAIRSPEEMIDTVAIEADPVTLPCGLRIQRLSSNHFEFQYHNEVVEVDLNLPLNKSYELPYTLQHHEVERTYFSIIHTGEGDGWDINRPCMSSVIMFQGNCYLIDAPPHIDQILTHLGIDMSEVVGIFHTHSHDDHFAGLTTLMRAGHKIKYYASHLVRSAVTKKLTALLGQEEQRFSKFFEIHDLEFDVWNDCDGMEVMPFYSPHPVENNLFLFRVLGGEGYRSYAHWADLSSFSVLDSMTVTTYGKHGLSPELLTKIKANYLTAADIKKIDIGGGLIHGCAKDFVTDTSGQLILAHTARNFTPEEREIGSSATFGAEDILICSNLDFQRQRAYQYLCSYFPNASMYRINAILNSPVINLNAGVIVLRRGQKPDYVDLILTGSLEFILSNRKIRLELSTGALVGEQMLFQDLALEGSYRTISQSVLLRIPVHLFRAFLKSEGLINIMYERLERIAFLRRTWLLGERIGHTILNRIAEQAELVKLKSGEKSPPASSRCIWIIKKGSMELSTPEGIVLEKIIAGDFSGEMFLFPDDAPEIEAYALDDVELLLLRNYHLEKIPIVLFKLLETVERRKNLTAIMHQ